MVNNPGAVGDDAVVEAVRRAVRAGETDAYGGVPPATVERFSLLARSTLRARLAELAEDGRLRAVWGIGRSTARPRRSYLPAEKLDDDTARAYP